MAGYGKEAKCSVFCSRSRVIILSHFCLETATCYKVRACAGQQVDQYTIRNFTFVCGIFRITIIVLRCTIAWRSEAVASYVRCGAAVAVPKISYKLNLGDFLSATLFKASKEEGEVLELGNSYARPKSACKALLGSQFVVVPTHRLQNSVFSIFMHYCDA